MDDEFKHWNLYAEGRGLYLSADPDEKALAVKPFKEYEGKTGKLLPELGVLYYEGLGVERDYGEAIRRFEAATEYQADAKYHLALCYLHGHGVKKDEGKAFEILLKHCRLSRYPEHQLLLSRLYYQGIGTDPDPIKGVEHLQRAYFYGSDEALEMYPKNGMPGDEIFFNPSHAQYKTLRRKADGGDMIAQYKTGLCLFLGRGVRENDREAYHYFELAANQGHPRSHDYLGRMAQSGVGHELDLSLGHEWYLKGAKLGDPWSMDGLSLDFEHGKGCLVNDEKAFFWCKKAADLGVAGAQLSLSAWYEKGEYVEENPKLAHRYCLKAAKQGNLEAMTNLGVYIKHGYGCKQSIRQAKKWLSDAAYLRYPRADMQMALLYLEGAGVRQSVEKAREWLDFMGEDAAWEGDEETAFAAYLLIKLLEAGEQIPTDIA